MDDKNWFAPLIMNILFIHQNFPGQFKHLAPALAQRGHNVAVLTLKKDLIANAPGINFFYYQLDRGNATNGHPWTVDYESKIIRAEACFKAALTLKSGGYSPDVIVAHPGWGESLFLKTVWPQAKLGIFCEWYYHATGYDVGFDSEFAVSDPGNDARIFLKNANALLHSEIADGGMCPTHWQASTYPPHIKKTITVVHDGIDTEVLSPDHGATFVLPDGTVLTRKDNVVTFINRSLEPYRGLHTFLRSVPEILIQEPDAHILIVGSEGTGYGAPPPNNMSWRQIFSEQVFEKMDASLVSRIHFLGKIPYNLYINLLQVSTVHVYLTYPFVLSWSLLEAMSIECAIVASDTGPVQEAMTHDESAVLVDFFSPILLAAEVVGLLRDPPRRERVGRAARVTARANYDLKNVCQPKQIAWVESLTDT